MYHPSCSAQPEFKNFYLPFSGKLTPNNRWVILAGQIPWELVEQLYTERLQSLTMGAPAHSARMAFGAIVIKERLALSDAETVETIQENPYLQFFIGLPEFQETPPFDSSQMVHFRKRFPQAAVDQINETIALAGLERQRQQQQNAKQKKRKTNHHDKDNDKGNDNHNDNDKGGTGGTPPAGEAAQPSDANAPPPPPNCGKLILDASCAPADITYPTDLGLLNKAREKCEKIIDVLHGARSDGGKKPRSYRKKARKKYLAVAKSKGAKGRRIRRAVGEQLAFVRRNLKHIRSLAELVSLATLSCRQWRDLLVIQELYRQQQAMYDTRSHRIDDRIVSISQPHVRPIQRGKAKAKTEFGAKFVYSLVGGYVFNEQISWNNFNEATLLQDQIRKFRERFGCWPKSVHADRIYRNLDNRKFCQANGIRMSGPALGRPKKPTATNGAELAAERAQAYQDEVDRIPIEGKFGQGKRRFTLGLIMAKLPSTSATVISLNCLLLNLEKILQAVLSGSFFAFICALVGWLRSCLATCRVRRTIVELRWAKSAMPIGGSALQVTAFGG